MKGLIAGVAGDAVDYVAGSVGFEPAKGRLFRVFARRISFLGTKPRTISRILAVVELAGAIDREHADLVKQIPPTLILHGSEDARVPV